MTIVVIVEPENINSSNKILMFEYYDLKLFQINIANILFNALTNSATLKNHHCVTRAS